MLIFLFMLTDFKFKMRVNELNEKNKMMRCKDNLGRNMRV